MPSDIKAKGTETNPTPTPNKNHKTILRKSVLGFM